MMGRNTHYSESPTLRGYVLRLAEKMYGAAAVRHLSFPNLVASLTSDAFVHRWPEEEDARALRAAAIHLAAADYDKLDTLWIELRHGDPNLLRER